VSPIEKTLRLADSFLEEARRDLLRAAQEGADLPPRIRAVQERAGHSTPEYRTLAIPVPPDAQGAFPTVLSRLIARYAATASPHCLLLVLDALDQDADGNARSILICEARDRMGTRLFFVQPFRLEGGTIHWEEPVEGGWQDPGEQEMILDAAFER
jgi:hypothetical protein